MSAFVDTSAFYALLDSADRFHAPAADFWARSLEAGEALITNQLVAVEAVSLLLRRHGAAAVAPFREAIAPVIRIVAVSEAELDRAMLAVVASGRRHISIVDRTSFETMTRLGVERVFAFDPDFEDAGFEVVPAMT